MKYTISRRDFLNGVALGTGTTLLAPSELFAQDPASAPFDYYPPTLSGIRGNHPGSFEVSHALAWSGQKPASYRNPNEHYDLVIVGAGVSGLAAARFYQKRMGADAKILLLDNHDDFGGHAKRNEFHYDGQVLLGIGGSLNLESPGDYSRISKGLLDELGVDLEALSANMTEDALMSVRADSMLALPGPDGHVMVRGHWIKLMLGIGDYESAVRALPLPRAEQDKLIEFISGDVDYLEGLSLGEKTSYVQSTTYAEFLTERVGFAKETISIFYPFAKLMAGPAASRISVMEAFYLGNPGIQSMGWLGDLASQLIEGMMAGYQSLYFPDG
ncbi:MAG: FAD/NAD(P)-binding protein, partial [Pseudomonadota bacterium]